MPDITIRCEYNHIPKIIQGITDGGRAIARAHAEAIADKMRDELAQPGTGRMYGSHQASSPGAPPANWTMALSNSIKVEETGDSAFEVGPESEYAPYLEFGTSKMAARPFIIPAGEMEWEPFKSDVLSLIRSLGQGAFNVLGTIGRALKGGR